MTLGWMQWWLSRQLSFSLALRESLSQYNRHTLAILNDVQNNRVGGSVTEFLAGLPQTVADTQELINTPSVFLPPSPI